MRHQNLLGWYLALLMIVPVLLAGCATQSQGDARLADGTPVTTMPIPNAIQTAAPARPQATPPLLTPTASLFPTPSPQPPDWITVARGVQRVYLPVPTPESTDPSYVYVLRIDPALADLKVIYDEKLPHKIDEWQAITKAPIIFNSGFFTGSFKPNGRIVTDGVLYGSELDYGTEAIGVPGMFAMTGRRPEIYALGRASYNPHGLRFDQAVEAYPLLLLPGGQPTFPQDTHRRARRTVIGLDEDNYVIVIISDIALYSLYELSEWLAISNLRLDSALNLDGGRSTGLMVDMPGESKLINSVVPVPIVIAVYPLP